MSAPADAGGVDVLVIAYDVPAYGSPDEQRLGRVDVATLRRWRAEGHFGNGSMGPKAEAACRFVESGGHHAAITNLDTIAEAVAGRAGTVIEGSRDV